MASRTVIVNCLQGESPSTEQRGDATLQSIAGNLLAIVEHLPDLQRAEALLLLGCSWHPPGKESAAQRRTLYALLGQAELRAREDAVPDAQARTNETEPYRTGVLELARTRGSDALALAHCLWLIFSNTSPLRRTTIIAVDFWKSVLPALDVHALLLPLLHLDVEGFQNFLYPHRKRSLPELALPDTSVHQAIRRMKSPKSRFFTRLPERDCGLVCALGGDVQCGYLVGASGDTIGIQVRAPRHAVFLIDTPNFGDADLARELRQALLAAVGVPASGNVTSTVVELESKQAPVPTSHGLQGLRPRAQLPRAKMTPRRRRAKPKALHTPQSAARRDSTRSPAPEGAQHRNATPTTPNPWRITRMVLDPNPARISGQRPGRILQVHIVLSSDSSVRTLHVVFGQPALRVFLAFYLAACQRRSEYRAIDLHHPLLGTQSLRDFFPPYSSGKYHKPVDYIDKAFDKACKKVGFPDGKIRIIKAPSRVDSVAAYQLGPEYVDLISIGDLRKELDRSVKAPGVEVTDPKVAADDALLLKLLKLADQR